MTTPSSSDARSTDGPVTTFRGAAVEVDVRRTTRIVVVASLVALAVLVAVLFVTDATKSSQIFALQDHGVPVNVTVTQCRPQLSGSGSSIGGYTCYGRFDLRSVTYREQILGVTTGYATGHALAAIADPRDPANVYPAQVVRTTHRTWTIFLIPIVLSVVLVALSSVAVMRVAAGRRRSAG